MTENDLDCGLELATQHFLQTRFHAVRTTIAQACTQSHRNLADVTLLAATKFVPPAQINYAIRNLGLTDIGENRVQELLEKYEQIDRTQVRLHFIGSLQINKVKYIADKVCMIHSLDRVALAQEIEKQMCRLGRTMDVLIEINSGEEPEKGGILPKDFPAFYQAVRAFAHLRVRGIMTMAPKCEQKSDYEKFFLKTYQIFVDNFIKNPHNIDTVGFLDRPEQSAPPILSMGMSDSYEQAIFAGTTMVRIGSALFGARPPKLCAGETVPQKT